MSDENGGELTLTHMKTGDGSVVALTCGTRDGESFTTKIDIAVETDRDQLADAIVGRWPAFSVGDVLEQLEQVAASVVAGSASKPKVTQADLLVRLARERYRVGRTEADEPFVVPLEGPRIALMLRGGKCSLRAELSCAFHERHDKVPSASSLADAMLAIEGDARRAEPETVYLRMATDRGRIVLDLGDAAGGVVVIEDAAWRVEPSSPVLFRRSELTGALPVPSGDGRIDALRDLLNVTDSTWPVLVGWMVAAFFTDIPHPIAFLGGLHGTGKSTAAEMLVRLIDPGPAPLRTQPTDLEQWALSASGSWIVALDNISSIPAWWSDALCRAVTGDGLVRRRLYTDGDLSVLSYKRVLLLTSIDAGALRGDLGDRLLHVDLEPIEDEFRRGHEELWQEFRRRQPGILGALLTVVTQVHAELENIALPAKGRMADFELVLAALDRVLGLDALEAYRGQRARVALDVVESSPVHEAIVELAHSEGEWIGTAGTLLERLVPEKGSRGWPPSARAMAGVVRRAIPALAQVGVEVIPPSPENRGAGRSRDRLYTIRLARGGASSPVQTAQRSETASDRRQEEHPPRTVGEATAPNRPSDRPRADGLHDVSAGSADAADGPDDVVRPALAPIEDERARRFGW